MTQGAMIPNRIEPFEVSRFMDKQSWAVEPKFDGVRALLIVTPGRAEWFNRNGEALTKPTPVTLPRILANDGLSVALDGEILSPEGGPVSIFFDILALEGADLRPFPLLDRRQVLEELSRQLPILVAPQENAQKHAMLQRAADEAWEGVVFKDLKTSYKEGRSSSWLKLKFTNTTDCVVVGLREDGKESATLALYWGHLPLEVGKCSLLGKGMVRVGDVLEVRHLPSIGRLREPRMIRLRTDKRPSECTIGQLGQGQREWIQRFAPGREFTLNSDETHS